jgi:serine/threonine-protein kinase
VLSAVITAEPPPIDDPVRVPALVDRIIRRCLEKEPNARFRSASDLAFALENLTPTSSSGQPSVAGLVSAHRWRSWLLAVAMMGAAFALGWVLRPTPPRAAPPKVSFTIQADPSARWPVSAGVPSIALAPDGLAIAFSVPEGSRPLMYRAFADAEARALPNTSGARSPFFSPDGMWIGYYLDGALRRVPIAGGATATISAVRELRGAVWTDDDQIIYATRDDGLWRVQASGRGTPELLVPLPANAYWAWPFVLEGGRTVLISQRSAFGMETGSILAIALDTKTSREVIGNAGDAAYANGRLYFGRGDALWSVPFDPVTATVTGRDEVAVPNVERANGNGETQYALSPSGTLAFVPFQPRQTRQLVLLDHSGRTTAVLTKEAAEFLTMAVSPAGDRIALRSQFEQSPHLTVVGLAGQTVVRIPTLGYGNGLAWLDGERIAYAGGSGFAQVLAVRADGAGDSQPVTQASSFPQDLLHTAANGDVLYVEQGSQYNSLLLQPSTGSPQRIAVAPFTNWARLSPDRRFLLYEANGQVTLQPADADGPRRSIGNGRRPVWSRDGKRIYFLQTSTEGVVRVMSVGFAGIDVGPPMQLFECDRCVQLHELPAGQFAVLRAASAPNPAATINVILQGLVSTSR